jgi:uncharacterized protein (DUF927 family)
MSLELGIKEEEALALAGRLNQTGQDMVSLCDAIKKSAEAAEALTHTLNQNMVVRDYLVEIAAALEGVVPGIETVATQLKNAAESGIEMAKLADARALVQ